MSVLGVSYRSYRVWQRNRDVVFRPWFVELVPSIFGPLIVLTALGLALGRTVGGLTLDALDRVAASPVAEPDHLARELGALVTLDCDIAHSVNPFRGARPRGRLCYSTLRQ